MYGVVIDPNRLNGGFCTAKNAIDSADYSFVNVWESHEYLSGSLGAGEKWKDNNTYLSGSLGAGEKWKDNNTYLSGSLGAGEKWKDNNRGLNGCSFGFY